MRRLRHLTNRHRSPSTNIALGLLLAFNAGAINAGGFLVLHMYTSHMTGFASQLADALILSDNKLLLNATGAIIAFMIGAATCSFLVNWARQHGLYGVYAIPLLLEALMMLNFGLIGTVTLTWNTPFALPLTVLLLSFMMGLQNAVGSKTSGGSIRTTHMTGNITDLGMELGKIMFITRMSSKKTRRVQHNWRRLHVSLGLLGMFIVGGGTGALGFKFFGFIFVLPLAALLLTLSIPPLLRDVNKIKSQITSNN
ncbi:YoaK family protein [Comamonas sp. MYb69]|uniref:YoaK family protein n=1 Tax=Comamonas sp. MYb69 TaxID=1848650 RepID=UPI0030A6E1AE